MTFWPLQVALFERLTAWAPLMGLVSGVYDEVPENVIFPYVSIGEFTETPFDTDDSTGTETVIDLHTWSRYRGQRELRLIQEELYAALHRHALEVAGASTVTVEWERSETLEDPDAITRHGITTFRIITERT